jgi:ubiquinone/menaquinone biosynthesis C-methylase UbiE
MLDFYDAELRAHHEHLRAAYGIARGDEVLDIGCGAGLTTREAGRASAPGRVVGVDVSEPMLQRARERTAADALENVSYVLGDAQRYAFKPGRFDLAISRFGLMFFSDPVAAFTNIASALRPEARLAALVWQRRERNEWASAIAHALGHAPPPPAAFSLGDAAATTALLERAGFEDVRLEDVDEPVFYGHDVDAVLDIVRGFDGTRVALAAMSPDDAAQAIGRLRATIEDHHNADHGVVFAARSWLITGRRRAASASTAAPSCRPG